MTIGHFDTTTVRTGIEINLSGGTATDLDAGTAVGGFLFASNGVTYKYQGFSSSLLNIESDWIFPRDTFDAVDWQIRGTHVTYVANTTVSQTGTALIADTSSPFAAGSWYGLSVNRSFYWQISSGLNTRDFVSTILFEIRNITDTSYNKFSSSVDAVAIAGFGTYSVDIETLPQQFEPGPACFTGNMRVLMADGAEKPIADIVAGDMVMSYNESTDSVEAALVKQMMVPRYGEVYEVHLSNGTTIETTVEHPFRTASGGWASINPNAVYQPVLGGKWVRPSVTNTKLREGTLLHGIDGDVRVTKVVKTGREDALYHISKVDEHHNFFVEGMCVHNIEESQRENKV